MKRIKEHLSKVDKDKVKEQAISFLGELKNKISLQDLDKVKMKLPKMNRGALKEVWENVGDLWAFVNNKDVSIVEKTIPLAALVYVISPLDVIPDSFPLAGLLDDASIVSYVFASIATQINVEGIAIPKQTESKKDNECFGSTTDDYKKRIVFLTSILTHAAYSDGEMCSIEEQKIKEITDFFVFSENGWYSYLNELNTKEEITVLIDNTIKQPIALKKIIEFVNSPNEEEEMWYFYAYTVIASDNEIHPSEREFLDFVGEGFNIPKYDLLNIERTYKERWLDD